MNNPVTSTPANQDPVARTATARTAATQPGVWPALLYGDAEGARRFLTEVFGFEESTTVRDGGGTIAHGELRWPEGGGVMYGSASNGHTGVDDPTAATQLVYVVTADPDAVAERARRAGATIVDGLRDTDYGSRAVTIADPDGNVWTFGTYAGS